MKVSKAPLLAALLMGIAQVAAAEPAGQPDVATLLFGTPQWGDAPVGSAITYDYTKTTTDPTFGKSFKDTVKIKLDKGDDADSRTVELHLFSGMNTKPAGPVSSTQQNPVLIFALQENLEDIMKIFGIPNPRYLKNAVRKAWRDDAKIEKVELDVDGKKVPGTRISVTPYTDDPQKDLMKGLDGMTYVVETSDQVPGDIYKVDIHAPADGPSKFSEVLAYHSETK